MGGIWVQLPTLLLKTLNPKTTGSKGGEGGGFFFTRCTFPKKRGYFRAMLEDMG